MQGGRRGVAGAPTVRPPLHRQQLTVSDMMMIEAKRLCDAFAEPRRRGTEPWQARSRARPRAPSERYSGSPSSTDRGRGSPAPPRLRSSARAASWPASPCSPAQKRADTAAALPPGQATSPQTQCSQSNDGVHGTSVLGTHGIGTWPPPTQPIKAPAGSCAQLACLDGSHPSAGHHAAPQRTAGDGETRCGGSRSSRRPSPSGGGAPAAPALLPARSPGSSRHCDGPAKPSGAMATMSGSDALLWSR